VGHEVDYTIADFVADLRAPTPSAAAEIVVARKDEYCARIDRLSDRLAATIRHDLQRRRGAVHALIARRGFGAFTARVAMRGRHVAELTHGLRRSMGHDLATRERRVARLRLRLEGLDLRRRLAQVRHRLAAGEGRLAAALLRRRHDAESRLGALAARLETLSPLAVLGRGYALVWNADRSAIIRSAGAVQAGDRVHVVLAEGEISADVVAPLRDGAPEP
jgi:exodeoxyribonuclease VII large subunit